MPVPPPVEMLITTSLRCLMPRAYSANTAGSGVGLPSWGLRACRCSTAAPASAAATPWSTICSDGVRQVRRHRRRVPGTGECAGDDDLAGASHGSGLPTCVHDVNDLLLSRRYQRV